MSSAAIGHSPMPTYEWIRRNDFPQGLKPKSSFAVYGTTEVVPFQNINDDLCGRHHSMHSLIP